MYKYGRTSESRFIGVHEDLVNLFRLVITRVPFDIMVAEGRRTARRQQQLFDQKKTWTLNSRHLDGNALDIWPLNEDGTVPWDDMKNGDDSKWVILSKIVFQCADELKILVQWGGDWDQDGQYRDETKFDGPHWQIPWPSNLKTAKWAQERRSMLGHFSNEVNKDSVKVELSPDITPGLKPEDMKDEDFEPPKKKRKPRKKKVT